MFIGQQLRSLIQWKLFLILLLTGCGAFSANVLIYDPLDGSNSVNANSGTATNILYVAGKYGNAASFSYGSSIAFDTEQPFNIYKGTVSMWVKPNFNGASYVGSSPLLSVKLSNGGYFRIYVYSSASGSAFLTLKIVDADGTMKQVTSADTAIGLESSGNGVRSWVAGNWYYVQVSWDLTLATKKIAIKIGDNGGEYTSSLYNLGFDNCLINNTLYLGNFESGTGYFNGAIDEFRYTDSYTGTEKMNLLLHDTCETLDKMNYVNGAVQTDTSLYSRKWIKSGEIPRDMAVEINDSDVLYYPLVSGKNCPSDISRGTVEFWFKPNWNGSDYTENKYLLHLKTENSYKQIYIYFYYNAGTRLLAAKYQEDSSTKRTIEVTDSNIINSIKINQWYHIKYYWDHVANKTELYLNGELIGQYSGTVNELNVAPDKLYIGSISGGIYQGDACFDDIKLYSEPHDSSFPEIFKNEPQAVPTYHCMSLYWDLPFGGNLDSNSDPTYPCTIQYKKNSETTWQDGLELFWHPYDHEYKGSVVHLAPDTVYDFRLSCNGVTKTISMKTMCEPDNLPINSTTFINSRSTCLDYATFTSGSALGYNVYDGQNIAEISGALLPAVRVMNRSYIILKNFVVDGAKIGLDLRGNCKNVILQNITFRNVGYQYGDSGVADKCAQVMRTIALTENDNTRIRRLTIEKCKVENLNYSANSWFEFHPDPTVNDDWTSYHPGGSNAFRAQSGMERQLVIRYNEFCSADGKYYEDIIQAQVGGGFGEDVDIYGNYLEYGTDDGIEPDEGGMNNRIFGNYITNCLVAVSSQSLRYGPLYVFRNICEKVAPVYANSGSTVYAGIFAKTGPGCDWMEDMENHYPLEYWFNNTMLNRDGEGIYKGIILQSGPKPNVVAKNNIIECRSGGTWAVKLDPSNVDNIDYNFCNAAVYPYAANMNGTTNTSFTGFYSNLLYWNSISGEANTFLNSSSDGYDQAVKINNFTTFFDSGNYPDAGAMDHEKNNNMRFGRNAYLYYVSGKWY